jgi:pimeloyl-ACP methyl ester carboxylesterase
MAKKPARRKTRAKKVGKKKAGRRSRATPQNGEGPRSGFALDDDEVENALITGEYRDLLEDYFGEEAYEELRGLSTRARSTRARGGPRVLVLPGIMGSKLGRKRKRFNDVIWLGPADIVRGKLRKLRMPDGGSIEPLGVMLFTYLKLKLKLRLAGFDVDFHPFDWRRDVTELGAGLAARIRSEAQDATRSGDVYLVAHSMGGLVSRAAIKQLNDKGEGNLVRRLIMLGTPNFGSFSPVQALAGYHRLVRMVAAVDLPSKHDELVNDVFGTFTGLYQMLPAPQKYTATDLYDLNSWPDKGFRPNKDRLLAAPDIHSRLAPGADNMTLIAGINQETIVGVRHHVDKETDADEFVFSSSYEGDGTVPLEFALLDEVETYYVEEKHGSLPNNREVARAVIDLIETGSTDLLPKSWSPSRRGIVRELAGSDLAPEPFEGRTGNAVSAREVRQILDEFAAPAKRVEQAAPVAVGGTTGTFSAEPIVVGRKRQSRIDLVIAKGDITQSDTRAVVLGVFKDVPPSGAARAVDMQLKGAVSEFSERRLFSANVGDVFIMPANRSSLRTDFVVFAGLGTYDDFSESVLRQVAENISRVLARTHVDDFATVLLGAGSGMAVGDVLANLAEGFLRGLAGRHGGKLRAITFVENDTERFAQLHSEVLRLTDTALFDNVEATVSIEELPAAPVREAVPSSSRDWAARQPVYLLIRDATRPVRKAPDAELTVRNQLEAEFTIRASLLTAGAKATVITDEIQVDGAKLNQLLATIETPQFNTARLQAFGTSLAESVLPPLVLTGLAGFRDHPLMLIHDANTSRIPWETVCIAGKGTDKWFPAAGMGISRKYEAEDLSVAKWLEDRRLEPELSVLLIVNPTEDLPGAESEGKNIKKILDTDASIKLTELWRGDATLAAIRAAFRSGEFDVVHYAGHAYFDRFNRARSGLLCHGGLVLTGMDLVQLEHLPALLFFNACESARVRSVAQRDSGVGTATRLETNIGLAESLLRAGVANYLGTYWPVGDAPAMAFGRAFYTEVAGGKTIGEALQAGRGAIKADSNSVDWADYIHYGSPEFRLKKGS